VKEDFESNIRFPDWKSLKRRKWRVRTTGERTEPETQVHLDPKMKLKGRKGHLGSVGGKRQRLGGT